MKFLNAGFDHVEFCVSSIALHAAMWKRMGFEQVGFAEIAATGSQTAVMAQGQVRILLTQYNGMTEAQSNLGYQFLKAHQDAIAVIGVEVDDAEKAFKETVARGARPALAPLREETGDGTVTVAEIYTPSDLRYRFVSRRSPKDLTVPALFLPGLVVDRMVSPSPTGLQHIDHLTNNIDMGRTDVWVKYYQDIFDFSVVRHFDIRTGRTGLTSEVVQSSCGRITVPINEATERESQVQEFVDRLHGEGVQHLAFLNSNIVGALQMYREQGFKFLSVPSTYYDVVPTRVPGVKEDLKTLESLGILLDGEGGGYLMQVFSEELVGPFFVEIIQRCGNNGFGEGNFRALFEAIERDQERRGVLPKQ
jgi:4-hydroxyphenylpyruvate dioxygenase